MLARIAVVAVAIVGRVAAQGALPPVLKSAVRVSHSLEGFAKQAASATASAQQVGQHCKLDATRVQRLGELLSEALSVHNTSGLLVDEPKLRYVLQSVCSLRVQPSRICELGFHTGHTSLLFLEAIPKATVLAFAPAAGKTPVSAAELVRDAYPGRFKAIFGPTSSTVAAQRKEHPEFACDVIFMDNEKDFGTRLVEVGVARELAASNARLYLNEVCSQECARGSTWAAWGVANKPCFECNGGGPMAYGKAAQLGILSVANCSQPSESAQSASRKYDGVCEAKYSPTPSLAQLRTLE